MVRVDVAYRFPCARFLLASGARRHTHTHVRFRLVGNCLDRRRRADRDRPQGHARRDPHRHRHDQEGAPHGRRIPDPCRRDGARGRPGRREEGIQRHPQLGPVQRDREGTSIRTGRIRNTFDDNPLEPTYPAVPGAAEVSTLAEVTVVAPPGARRCRPEAPAAEPPNRKRRSRRPSSRRAWSPPPPPMAGRSRPSRPRSFPLKPCCNASPRRRPRL